MEKQQSLHQGLIQQSKVQIGPSSHVLNALKSMNITSQHKIISANVNQNNTSNISLLRNCSINNMTTTVSGSKEQLDAQLFSKRGVNASHAQTILNASDWRSFSKELLKDDKKTLAKEYSSQHQKVQSLKSKLIDPQEGLKNRNEVGLLESQGFFTERKRSINPVQGFSDSIQQTDQTLNTTREGTKIRKKNKIRMSLDSLISNKPSQYSQGIIDFKLVNPSLNQLNQNAISHVNPVDAQFAAINSKDQGFQQEMQSMKFLQNIKYYNFFRDFEFPECTDQIKDFIDKSKKQRPFKQIYKILQKRLVTYSEANQEILRHKLQAKKEADHKATSDTPINKESYQVQRDFTSQHQNSDIEAVMLNLKNEISKSDGTEIRVSDPNAPKIESIITNNETQLSIVIDGDITGKNIENSQLNKETFIDKSIDFKSFLEQSTEKPNKKKSKNQGESQFKKNAIMNQRDQYVVLEQWFNFMVTKYQHDNFEQLLVVAFAMGDLIQMEFLSCSQKGHLLLEILQFFLSNQLRWLDNDNSKDMRINSLVAQLKAKKRQLKTQEDRANKAVATAERLTKEMEELEAKYQTLYEQKELLDSKYAYEHRLMEKKFNKEREEMRKAHDEQKQIIEETLDTMIKLKQDGNWKGVHKIRNTDSESELSSGEEEELMMQREEIYQNKLGRQDSLTRDLMQKNQDYKRNRQKKGLYEIEMEKMSFQNQQNLRETQTSLKVPTERGEMSSKNRDNGMQSANPSQQAAPQRPRMRLKTKFGKEDNPNMTQVKDQEIQTNEKRFEDEGIQVKTSELSKDATCQITPPIVYTQHYSTQTEAQLKSSIGVQSDFELLELLIEERANEIAQEKVIAELKKMQDHQSVLDDISNDFVDKLRLELTDTVGQSERDYEMEAIDTFDIHTQKKSNRNQSIKKINDGQKTNKNIGNSTNRNTMGNTLKDFSDAKQAVGQSKAAAPTIPSTEIIKGQILNQKHRRTSSVEADPSNLSKAIKSGAQSNQPSALKKQLTKQQVMKQDISSAISKNYQLNFGQSAQKPRLNSQSLQGTDGMIDLIKKFQDGKQANGESLKMEDLVSFLQNEEEKQKLSLQQQSQSQSLPKQGLNNSMSKFKPSANGNAESKFLTTDQEDQFLYSSGPSQYYDQKVGPSKLDIRQLMQQFELQLRNSKSPLLNSLLDKPEIQKLFTLVIEESERQKLLNPSINEGQMITDQDFINEDEEFLQEQSSLILDGSVSTRNKNFPTINIRDEQLGGQQQSFHRNLNQRQQMASKMYSLPFQTEESLPETKYEEDMLKELIMNDSQLASVELPKILFRASDKFQRSLEFLPKDEYGDFILKNISEGDADEGTRKVIERGEKLKEWIDYLQRDKDISRMISRMADTQAKIKGGNSKREESQLQKITVERGIQTEKAEGIESINQMKIQELQKKKQENLTTIKAKYMDSQTTLKKQTESQLNQNFLKKINTQMKSKKLNNSTSAKNLSLLVARDALEVQRHLDKTTSLTRKAQKIFFPLPLNFENGVQKAPNIHPMSILFEKFLIAIAKKDTVTFFKGVHSTSVKLLIRTINGFLSEKAEIGFDHLFVKNQHLREFIFDQCVNKFGIQSLAEKKVKETLMTIMKNQPKVVKCTFYARLFGFDHSNDNYSNDDLSLIYKLNIYLNSQQSFFHVYSNFRTAFDTYKQQRHQHLANLCFENETARCDAVVEFYLTYFESYFSTSSPKPLTALKVPIVQETPFLFDKIDLPEEDQEGSELQRFIDDMREFLITQHKLVILPMNKSKMEFKDFRIKSEKAYEIVIMKYQQIKQDILTFINRSKLLESLGILQAKQEANNIKQIENVHITFQKFEELINHITSIKQRKLPNDDLITFFDKNKFVKIHSQDENQESQSKNQGSQLNVLLQDQSSKQNQPVISLEKILKFIFKHKLL